MKCTGEKKSPLPILVIYARFGGWVFFFFSEVQLSQIWKLG